MTSPEARNPVRSAVAVLLFALVLVATAGVVSSYPAVCASCHAPQARALAATGHRDVACYDCHLPAGGWSILEAKANEFLSMYPAYLLGRSPSGSGVRISRAACAGCHGTILKGVVAAGGLRIRHSSCAAPPGKCDACHSDASHAKTTRWARTANMDDCIGCHVTSKARIECDECHSKLVRMSASTSGSLRVTHGPDWKQTHGLADLRTCVACHGEDSCVRCHGTRIPHPDAFMAGHGKEAVKPEARCGECHKDRSACDSCHGIEMPHPADIRPKHSTMSKSRRDPSCLRCHGQFDCDNCHTGHAHPGRTDGTLGSQPLPKSGSVR